LGTVLSSRDYVDERTLFGYGKKINRLWIDNYEVARKHQFSTEKKWFFRMKSVGLLTAAFCIVALFSLLFPALQGALSIGLFFSLVGTIFDLINAMSWEFTGHIDNLTQDSEMMKDLTTFLALGRITGSIKKAKGPFAFENLELKNVTFKYPNATSSVLNGISFKIEAGKHYSFVGQNGSGKTTIIKLLTGLYGDYGGEILLNNVSLHDYPQDVINSAFSNVFQDFARYSSSVRENIRIGDIHTIDTKNDRELIDILKDINFSFQSMDKGLDTQLGKLQENGIDLPGGQWQKIAIARDIVNSASVRLLMNQLRH
jgi:ATP-binding cassette subfamily B protein